MRLVCNAAASTTGEQAGNNPIGDVFKKVRGVSRVLRACNQVKDVDDEQTMQFYGIGTDQTIRYGVVKRPVMSNVPKNNGKELTWQQYRKETESRRKQLRSGRVLPTCPFCS